MPNWAGYDTADFLTTTPFANTACNPNNQQLATYTYQKYTQAANKYFARYFLAPGFSTFAPTEIAALRAATFYYLMPISAPYYSRETTGGTTGKTYGQQDATTTLQNIVNALNSGNGLSTQLQCYVYLDIEAGTPITSWYWEGWSETIYNYQDSMWDAPFYPCAYVNPNDTSTMNMLAYYANAGDRQHTCYGIWSTQPSAAPSNCTWCNNAPPPGWAPQGYTGFTVHHWQYALNGTCASSCDTCRPNIDMDQSNPNFDMSAYMLKVSP